MVNEKRILLVEDESIIAMDLRKMLRKIGFKNIQEAASAEEAMAAIEASPPDMVLMDIVLDGDVDGIELARSIGRTHDIPVIFITAHSDEKTVRRAVKTVPYGFIVKPVKANDLYSAIVTAFHKHEVEKSLTRERDLMRGIAETSPASIIVLDPEGAIIFANSRAGEIMGTAGEALTTRRHNSPEWRITDVDGNPFPEERLPFNLIMKSGKPVWKVRHAIHRPDGARVILSVNGAPLFHNGGTIERVVMSVEDITERFQMESIISRQNQDLKTQNEKLTIINEALLEAQNELLEVNRQLQNNRDMLHTVINTIPVRVFWKDRNLKYIGCNGLFAADAGLDSPAAIVGKTDSALSWKEEAELYRADDTEILRTGIPKIDFEEPQTRPDGSRLWLKTTKIPMKNSQGEVIGIFGSYEDITLRRQADNTLKKNEERFALVMEATSDGLWDLNFKTGEVYVSPVLYHTLGYEYLEIEPSFREWKKYIHPDDVETVFNSINDHLNNRTPNYSVECRIRKKNGQWIWVLNRGKVAERDPDGRPVRMVGTQTDIHERRIMEQAIRESEFKYRNMIEHSFDIVFTLDNRGVFLEANEAFLREGNYERGDIIGSNFSAMVHPEEAETALGLFEKSMSGEVCEFELRARRKNGSYGWYYFINTPIRGADGKVEGIHGIARNIMERKLAEVALRESERRYRLIVENATDVVFTVDLQGYFTYVNPPVHKLTGYTQVELTGSHFTRIIPEGWRKKLLKHYIRQIDQRVPETLMELPILTASGEEKWVELIVTLRLKGNEPIGLQSIVRDITDRKLAQDALKKSEEKYRFLVESITDVIYALDPVGNITYINPTIEQMSHYTVGELIGRNFTEFIHPEDLPDLLESYSRTMEGHYEPSEFRIVDKDGSVKYVRTSSRLVKNEDDEITGLTALMTDITGRVRAEMSLRESEAKFRALTESTATAIGIIQGDRIVYVNPSFEIIGGYTSDALNTMKFWDIIHPDFREEIRERGLSRQRGEEAVPRYEAKILTMDGREKWVDFTAKTIEFNNMPAVIVTGYDITERRLADEALRASEERLSITLNSIGDAVIATDTAGLISQMNPVAENLSGWSRDDARGKPVDTVLCLLNADDHEPRKNPVSRVLETGRMVFLDHNTLLASRDGKERQIADSCAPIKDSNGRIMGAVMVFRDITGELKLQEQLRQSQKMESIGRLAGGIAHDFNNLLTTIIGFSDLALQEMDQTDPVHEMIRDIMDAGKRGASLTQQLLAFSRKQVLEMMVLNLNNVVDGVEKMLRRLIRENIILSKSLYPSLHYVKADPYQIEQILMNLVVNARDVMPDGGNLMIETSNVVLDEEYSRIHTHVRPGRYVMLAVSDTGQGMEPVVLNRIFEPFYTTKEKGKGTGLGLSMVYGIVKQHEGTIMVYSEPGKGTAFKIYLPVTDEETTERETQAADPERLEGEETILVAEDNPEVLKLAHAILKGHGYRVLDAATPGEAIARAELPGEKIHLLLTDVIMPGLNGPELYNTLREFAPGLKVLYMSGYTDNAVVNNGLLEGDISYLQKPFTAQSLVRKVRVALDS